MNNRLSNNHELKDFQNLEALRQYHQGSSSPSTNSKQNIAVKLSTVLHNESSPNHTNNRKPSINRKISVSTKNTTIDEQQKANQQSSSSTTTTSVPRPSIITSSPQKSNAQRMFRTSLLAVRSARMFAFAGKQRSDQGLDELKLSQLLTQLLTLPIDLKDPQHAEVNQARDSSIMIAILSKKNKSLLESQYLSRCLLNLSLFSSNLQILADPASQRVILSEISYVAFPKGHSIFRFGEYGNHYYVVLKGSVFCFIPKPEFKDALLEEQINLERQVIKMKQNNTHKRTSIQADAQQLQQPAGETNSLLNTQQEQGQQQQQKLTDGIHEIILKTTTSIHNPNQQRGSSSLGIIKHEVILTDEFEQAALNNPEMSLAKVYNPGEAFGEIALMTKERRTASMVCREDSHLMVLSKEGFDRIIGKCEEGQVRQRVSFLKSFAFFASVGDSQLMSLLHFFTETVLHQKTVIYKEGDQVNSIYFIRQGEVHIQKHLDQLQNSDSVCNSGLTHEHNEPQHSPLSQIEQEQQYGQKQKRKILTLKILGPSQYFGQDEIFSHQSQRSLRAIALQSTVLLQISKRDLFSALKQYKQLDTFRSQNEMKQQWQKEREREYIATTESIPQADTSSNFVLKKSQLTRTQSPQLYSTQAKRNHGSSMFTGRSPLHAVAPGLAAVQNPLIFSSSFVESLGQKSQAKKTFLSNVSARDQQSDYNNNSIEKDKIINKSSSHITSLSTLSFRKIPEQIMVSTNTTFNSSRIQLTSPQNKLSACFSTKTIHVPHFKSTEPVSKNNLTLSSVKQFVAEDMPQQHIEILQQFQQNNQHNEEIMNQLLKKQTEKNTAGYLDMSSSSISRLPVFHQLTRVCQSPSTPKLLQNLKNPTETSSSSISSRSRSNHIKLISSQSQKDMLQTSISNSTSSRFSSSCRQIKAESDAKIPKQLLNYLLNLPNSSTQSSQKIKKSRNSSTQGNNSLGSSSNLETSINISPLSAPDAYHDELLQELNQQQQQKHQNEDHINEDYDKDLGDLSNHINSRNLSSSDKHNQNIPVVSQQDDCRQFAASKLPSIKRVFKNKKPFYFKLIAQNKIDPIQSICSQREALPK